MSGQFGGLSIGNLGTDSANMSSVDNAIVTTFDHQKIKDVVTGISA